MTAINIKTLFLAPLAFSLYSKTCVKRPLIKGPKCFSDQLSLNAGQKYCRMLQVEHSAILLTCIKLQAVIKIFAMSIFRWPFCIGFTVTLSMLAATILVC